MLDSSRDLTQVVKELNTMSNIFKACNCKQVIDDGSSVTTERKMKILHDIVVLNFTKIILTEVAYILKIITSFSDTVY
jgi:hypothetical protein